MFFYITHYLLLPHSIITVYPANEFSLFFFGTENEVSVNTDKETILLKNGMLFTGLKVQISNLSNEIVKVYGASFYVPKNINYHSEMYKVSIQNIENNMAREIMNEIKKVDFDSSKIEKMTYELIDSCFEKEYISRNETEFVKKIDSRLLIVNRYIRKNYSQPLTLSDLSEIINCNPVYLCNTYSKVFNTTPMRYLQTIRMLKAKELILNTNLNISDISKGIGYISISQFCNTFKKYYNMSPGNYRLKFRINSHIQ
ncbi:AraC family transcriptional regulator [Paenibacillus apiarius]|nr:AraC family transcriptional regulator [Paenibacillus apiarius]